MGTRLRRGVVERRQGARRSGDHVGIRRHEAHRSSDEHVERRHRDLPGEPRRRQTPGEDQPGAVQAAAGVGGIFRAHARRVRHHLCQRRLSIRLQERRAPGPEGDRQGAAGHQLAAHGARREEHHGVLHASRHAHRPRRHSQGPLGGSRHRDPAEAGHHARHGQRGWGHAHHRRSFRQALGGRRARPGPRGQGVPAPAAVGHRLFDLGRLRALLR